MKGLHPSKTVFGKNLKSDTFKFTPYQGRANPRRLIAIATKFDTVAPNMCGVHKMEFALCRPSGA